MQYYITDFRVSTTNWKDRVIKKLLVNFIKSALLFIIISTSFFLLIDIRG